MRPLAWRAPIIPVSQDDIDLQPMVEAMVGSDKGCIFRDFVVPEGAPHTVGNAIAWANKAASHATIVTSLIELLSPSLGAERAALIGGHCARHVLPEVGKALKLPREIRESLGYWREHPVIANEGDRAALARAITQARQRSTRAASIASSADRYASVDAATVVQDEARIACLLAIREAYQPLVPEDGRLLEVHCCRALHVDGTSACCDGGPPSARVGPLEGGEDAARRDVLERGEGVDRSCLLHGRHARSRHGDLL